MWAALGWLTLVLWGLGRLFARGPSGLLIVVLVIAASLLLMLLLSVRRRCRWG